MYVAFITSGVNPPSCSPTMTFTGSVLPATSLWKSVFAQLFR